MTQIYKVFVNNFFILFREFHNPEHKLHFFKSTTKDVSFEKHESLIYYLVNCNYLLKNNIYFYSNCAFTSFLSFKSYFHFIVAAGGVVENKKKQILLIHKQHKWDLPKGKVDGNETLQSAAIREVFEETNILCQIIRGSETYSTYHIYTDKHNDYQPTLKHTTWFFMRANPNQFLRPQIDEGISDARWVSFEDLHSLKTYESIRHPISYFMK